MRNFSLVVLLLLGVLSSCSRSHQYEDMVWDSGTHQYRRKPVIVVDAGHGGEDFGTQSEKDPFYREKDFTIVTARMLKNCLQSMGYRVVMVRETDVFIPLKERATFANSNRPEMFVSVHYNAAPSKQAQGIEVFYYKSSKDKERSQKSKVLAQDVLDRLLFNTSAKSRGVKHGDFAVIRETDMPAILVEGGFLSHNEERQKLRDKSYLKKIALGIAQGIQKYLE